MNTTELENLELENGGLTPTNCALLLAQYLLLDDFLNAKFLWMRTPVATKKDNEEIDALWAVGKKLSLKDFPAFFASVKQRQWSECTAPLITELVNKTRQRVFRLICLAYTTIRASDFAVMVDLPLEEAVRLATHPSNAPECRWNLDAASQMLENAHAGLITAKADTVGTSIGNADYHQRQFQLLTDYVSFLEN